MYLPFWVRFTYIASYVKSRKRVKLLYYKNRAFSGHVPKRMLCFSENWNDIGGHIAGLAERICLRS